MPGKKTHDGGASISVNLHERYDLTKAISLLPIP
jgi:hypothetical protein